MGAAAAPEADGIDPIEPLPPAGRSLWRMFELGWQHERGLLSLSLATTLATMLPDALLAWWLRLLAEGLTDGTRRTVVIGVAGLAVSSVATWWLSIIAQRVQRRFRDRIAVVLEAHVAELQLAVPTLEHQERPEYLDRLSVLREQVFTLDHLFLSLLSTVGWIFRLLVTVALLATVHPALVLLLVAALPTVLSSSWRPEVERRTQERVAAQERQARHLFALGTNAGPAKELRVLGLAPRLQQRRREAWSAWQRPRARVRWRSAGWHALGWACFGVAYGGAIAFVAAGIDAGVGPVVLVTAAGQRLSLYISAAASELGFLRGFWLDAARRLRWLELFTAARRPAEAAPPPARLEDGIRLADVSFRYPGSAAWALRHADLHLPAGTVVAIAGENGAGKSTLVKLLAGLYRPTEGRVTVDGVDLATMEPSAWRERLAGAFQDFFRFELPAQHSVGVGDEPRRDDRAAVEVAVGAAGAADVVARLPSGLDTQLGSAWPGGVEVSFGQWQKVGLARGFMRQAPLLLLLDEPTAALDAETEHALFERYADAVRTAERNEDGRITVLVSHRFSTVRMADLIVVLDGAAVVEVGSHEDLVRRGGRYAELFAIQAAAFG
ncbi:MAG: ABC transporter ATP-binding protein [Acidimicrobiales bacterium]|nr:ABC transporter ATP-binding protein [Acidimicrobiales bacterium]